MRVLIVHPGVHFSVADVWRGWKVALERLGCQVASFNFDDRIEFYSQAHLTIDGEARKAFDYESSVRMAAAGLKAALYEFWPDLLVIVSGFFIPPEFYPLIRSRGHKTVILFTESPYEDDRQIERCRYADLAVINDPANIESFRAVNPDTWYLPHAYDPQVHKPGPVVEDAASDCCFVGTGYPSRREFLEAVDWTGIRFALAGNWRSLDDDSPLRPALAHPSSECVDNTEAMTLYHSTRASMNLYRKEANQPDFTPGWAMGPREVELAATQTFFLREPRGEGDTLFPFLPTFTEPDEFGAKLRWWLARDDRRATAAHLAYEAVQDRTFDNHAKKLLSHFF